MRKKNYSLITLRKELLLTQEQLAKKAGVALRTMHSVESGRRCQMSTKRKILKALGLGISAKSWVFRDDG